MRTQVAVGAVVAASVFVFDVSIQFIHDLPDIFAKELHIGGGRATGFQLGTLAVPFRCIMPVGAGFMVAALQSQVRAGAVGGRGRGGCSRCHCMCVQVCRCVLAPAGAATGLLVLAGAGGRA